MLNQVQKDLSELRTQNSGANWCPSESVRCSISFSTGQRSAPT